MPDLLHQVWATPGLGWLLLTIAIAGLVRGFTGFGTAMIFVPIAGIFLSPTTVVAVMVLTGIMSNAAVVPRAWQHAARAEVGLLVLAAALTVPLGLWLLSVLDQLTVRWFVAAIVGSTFILLVAGWRFSGTLGWPGLLCVGAAAGIVGGMTGLTGPIVVLFYLAGQSAAQRIRANTLLFLALLELFIAASLYAKGAMGLAEVMLAVTLAIPYFVTTLIGQALFDPRHERLFRAGAYTVIGLAVLGGLPLWS